MLSAPSRSVQIPVQGMLGWDAEARRMGEGIRSLIESGTEWASEKLEVEQVAQQAQISARMQEVRDETIQDLQDAEVKDWDYAWQQASSGRVAEVLSELPPEQREAGRALASLYNAQASLEARRDHELAGIEQARQRWQGQLDRAVAQGDDAQAEQWLQLGRNVFVPEARMEELQGDVQSRSCLARWQGRLAEQPMETLAALSEAQHEALPARERDARHLSELELQTRRTVRRDLAERWAASVEQGQGPDGAEADLALSAGLLTPKQRDGVRAEMTAADARALSGWMRVVDECEDDEQHRTGVVLDIVTSSLPLSDRAALIRRLRDADGVARADRRALSQGLYRMYERGCLGNPADEQSCRRYLALQREALPVLLSGGAEASADWLRQQRQNADRWVCFES